MPWKPGMLPEPNGHYQRSLGLKICLDFLQKVDGWETAKERIDELGRAETDITFGLRLMEHLSRQNKRMIIAAFENLMSWDGKRPFYD